jgi:hypothetical protein
MLCRRCLLKNRPCFPFRELKNVLDFSRVCVQRQRLHISQINLLTKAGHQASVSVAFLAIQGESEGELQPFNQQDQPVKKPVVNNENLIATYLNLSLAIFRKMRWLGKPTAKNQPTILEEAPA